MLHGALSQYYPRYIMTVAALATSAGFKAWPYLFAYWRVKDFSEVDIDRKRTAGTYAVGAFLLCGILAQYALAGLSVWYGITEDWSVRYYVAAALVICAPVLWANLLAVALLLARFFRAIVNPAEAARDAKTACKNMLCAVLEAQVKRLRKKHAFRIVAVAGSVGKTSTKLAVASVLKTSRLVQYQDGNYNDRLTVPLIFFGQQEPSIYNVFAWLRILISNESRIHGRYPYDFVVVELGTDAPGQMAKFAYLKPELVIVTSVAPEHMEFFKTLDAVAKEELAVAKYAKRLLINADDTPKRYLEGLSYKSYGSSKQDDFRATNMRTKTVATQTALFELEALKLPVTLSVSGKQGAKIALAAAAAAHMLGLTKAQVLKGMTAVTSQPGRMQVLPGVKNSVLIDDTYNASPIAVKAALDVLYATKATQRIAILGTMNELGEYNQEAHTEIGSYCDPKKLDLVVTIGQNAKDHLAPTAEARGCKVESFMTPYQAGEFVLESLKSGGVVLAKGSQNGVFAEEAVKLLLANPDDQRKLVRQSAVWLAKKQKQFGS